ncbi:MAG: hypothetical protein RMY64_15115 [Nostoc sp. DedQUE08]|uniref:hypothetical protein n=1 Tax=Nostoc sp. DedQUE08 TaxID=3075393 RepID=UPI002AD37C29|nr:hypothetical protein [Nostoc sp. DedQUE08]MDZ8066929.1 hypothetical protein [Nostoc sp. DedQUE08]
MPEQVDFRFQFSTSSPYLPLLKYLSPKNKTLEFPRQNMIIWAIAAFWHPIACRWLGGFSESDLKSKARISIYQLQQQIIYLAQTFNLEQELENHLIVATPTDKVDTHLGSSPTHEDDDCLLENAFN